MRRLAYALFALGLVGGISTKVFASDDSDLIAIVGLVLLVATSILAVSSAMRIYRGDVRLRPLDALKSAAWLFAFIFGFKQLALFTFPGLDRELSEDLWTSGIVALVLGFHSTAYRKPE